MGRLSHQSRLLHHHDQWQGWAWNGSLKPKNVTATNLVSFLWKHDELVPCSIESWKSKPFTKTLGWRYLAWLYPSLCEDAYAKLQAFGDGRRTHDDVRGTSCFVIKFGKAGEQIAKEMGKKARWSLRLFQLTHPVKGNRGKAEGIASVSKVLATWSSKPMIMYSIQPDKTIETRYEQGWWSLCWCRRKWIPEMFCFCPVVIRKAIDIDKIMMHWSDHFNSGRQGNTIKR